MNQTSDSTFAERLETKVNIAEDKAESFYESKGIPFIRTGFNQYDEKTIIEADLFFKIPEKIRNFPDYIIIKKRAYLLEVKGCRENVNIKLCDLNSYDFWDKICPMVFFIYSIPFRMCYRAEYSRLKELLTPTFSIIKVYPDNKKEYYSLPVKELTLIGESCQW